jgi:rhodanese-related sulfurtransferase
VREEGQHGAGHPLLAVNLPYSRLELDIASLVPRAGVRCVLLDDGDGVAERAARRLADLGYGNLHILQGGAPQWQADGHQLFESTNVPSKAFAELIEHTQGTPHLEAAELNALLRSGADVKILDSRTVEEFGRFHVPGAISCPSAELVYRFADLVPSPDTFVVVSCAGRTRGIIGAQALINAGVPNRVAALAGGTQGWRLAGLELERQVPAGQAAVTPASVAASQARAAALATRFGVRRVDRATLRAWQGDAGRTTHTLDVRTPEEYLAGHVPGAVSAPGGQLVQAIDRWVGTRGARLVLTDDTGVRATVTAHWLQQMGWDVQVLEPGSDPAELEPGTPERAPAPAVRQLDPSEAAAWLREGAAAVSVDPSASYRQSHPAGAIWATRGRIDRLSAGVLRSGRIVVFAADTGIGALAARELAERAPGTVALAAGSTETWRNAGIALEASPDTPADAERIDTIFWNHDRHEGNQDAMRAYLRWETELPARITADGTAGFRIAAA